jgi:hypothetical protein
MPNKNSDLASFDKANWLEKLPVPNITRRRGKRKQNLDSFLPSGATQDHGGGNQKTLIVMTISLMMWSDSTTLPNSSNGKRRGTRLLWKTGIHAARMRMRTMVLIMFFTSGSVTAADFDRRRRWGAMLVTVLRSGSTRYRTTQGLNGCAICPVLYEVSVK